MIEREILIGFLTEELAEGDYHDVMVLKLTKEDCDILLNYDSTTSGQEIVSNLIRNYAKADQQQQLRAIAQLEMLKDESEVVWFLLNDYYKTRAKEAREAVTVARAKRLNDSEEAEP